MLRNLRNTIITACVGIMLTACGGGSSGSSSGPDVTGTGGEPVAITMDNAELTAAMVADVALGDGVFGALSGINIPTVPGATGAIATGAAKISRSSQLWATVSDTVQCAESGMVDIDVTISDPLQPTEGDVFALQFNQCDEGLGVVTNGGMIMTITDLEGNLESEQFLLGVRMELSAFQVTEGGETSGANGTVTITIDSRTPPLTTITVSTSALATSSEGTAEAVSNMTVTISEDQSTFPAAISVQTSFTVDSPRIGGAVTVTTSLAMQSSGEEYPYVGELRITGAGNSSIVMIALDANRVRLEIDVDGDGALDETIETTWDELMALSS